MNGNYRKEGNRDGLLPGTKDGNIVIKITIIWGGVGYIKHMLNVLI